MAARQSIAVIGSGISGLGAAWLLSQGHDVTLFEADTRAGGHSNTVEVPAKTGHVPVDTGFIVYNTACYPNLIALFRHVGVPTAPTDMGFAVSLGKGRYEYAGSSLGTLFAQPSNLASPAHWRMIMDVLRFFREAAASVSVAHHSHVTLGEYLAVNRYSEAFTTRHILPMAAAIWSTPSALLLDMPLAAFIRFFDNHGLLQIRDRPQWRTVVGGSREYVRRVLADFRGHVRLGEGARSIARLGAGVDVTTTAGVHRFDKIVLATHADDALRLLADADADERHLLGAFKYVQNRAVLHGDASLMPVRRRVWSSWNYLGESAEREHRLSVTYWMNKLQPLGPTCPDLFVTLNPLREASGTIATFGYAHPMFDARAMAAQRQLWQLQGRRSTWFCGSYFGYGFHEDGLQAGLAAAEDIGGVRRPWTVADESGRICIRPGSGSVARPPMLEAAE